MTRATENNNHTLVTLDEHKQVRTSTPTGGHSNLLEKVRLGLDATDRAIQAAFETLRVVHGKELERRPNGADILMRIEDSETQDAVVEYLQAAVRADAAQRRAKAALSRHEVAGMKVKALAKDLLGDPDLEFAVDVHNMLICKPSEVALEAFCNIARSVVDRTCTVSLEDLRSKQVPSEWKEAVGAGAASLEAFLADLADYLLRAGDTGFRLAESICTESAAAAQVLKDEDAPAPLRFLARLAGEALTRRGH